MALLSKEEILAAEDLAHEDVAVPEWGGTVRIRMMTGAERDAWEIATAKLAVSGGGIEAIGANARARLVAVTAVDEAGKLLFSAAEVEQLGAKSAAALDRLFAVAQKLNAVSERDIDELGKTFAALVRGGSNTSSPSG